MTCFGDTLEMDEMHWRIIDGIGPFMREVNKKRINWSKIIFSALEVDSSQADEFWRQVESDMLRFITRVRALGYNTITLDDVAHFTFMEDYEPEVCQRLEKLIPRLRDIVRLIKREGMRVLVTTDIIPTTARVEASLMSASKLEDWFEKLLRSFLDQNGDVDGVILRLGESDGKDVKELFHSTLLMKSTKRANAFLKRVIPIFEETGKVVFCRNWTVGAHAIGDLIWHRRTIKSLLEGIDSKNFIFSLKYGESDFFRYLPLSEAFFSTSVQKVIEFQARREYEGAGEFPSFVGFDVEAYAMSLRTARNLVGYSVWCQTGGWHGFRRLAFIHQDAFWIEQNVAVIAAIMGEQMTVQEWIANVYPDHFQDAEFFLRLNDKVIKTGLYISEFAGQKWFFRRTKIPPMLHVYWDCLFINHPVRKLMRFFVADQERMLCEAEDALRGIRKLSLIATRLGWPSDDLEFMYDTFNLILLAKNFYVNGATDELCAQIKATKKEYKRKYPRSQRQRYRVKVSYGQFQLSRRKMKILLAFFLRKKRRYRVLDHLVTLHLLRFGYLLFKRRNEHKIPEFARDSAMGIDVLFE